MLRGFRYSTKRRQLFLLLLLITTEICFAQNPIVTENSLPGNPASEWDVSGAGDLTIQGFATDISVNKGQTVHFKISTNASAYTIDIYRLGYYGGMGARKIGTGVITATLPQSQPNPILDGANGLVDCGNWSESATWDIPATAVSGIYIAKLTRTDNGGASHIVFIVRDDASHADLFFQASDATWQAYNVYGGNSLYVGATNFPSGHASKVSYNRPFITRSGNGGGGVAQDWVFNAEYPMIRFLERNGYDISYTTNTDAARFGSLILNHKVYMSVGHDEYWSAEQRANVEAARNAGVHLAFFSGNEIYWKTRWEDSKDPSSTPYRTLVCYKEGTLGEAVCGTKCDPSNVWTGLWRDGCNYPGTGGCNPENQLSGQISWQNGQYSMTVPSDFKNLRFWRNTSVASLADGSVVTFPTGTLGNEFSFEQYDNYYPGGRINMSSTTINGKTHMLSLYRHSSGALVFGAGTIQWSWGLDDKHDNGNLPANADMQQATINVLADMGAQPATLMAGMIAASESTDKQAPTSVISFPANNTTINDYTPITITGTCSDAGGGVLAGIEISFDNGVTWKRVVANGNWSYSWRPTGGQTSYNIMVRGFDDSGNIETIGSSGSSNNIVVNVTTSSPAPITVFQSTTVPAEGAHNDGQGAIEVGMKFRANVSGSATAFRFYKGVGNTGVHKGHLWSSTGVMLAEATFSGESASGWQEIALSTPVAINANTTYIVSYFSPNGFYAVTNPFFTSAVVNGALTGLANGTDGPNGVFKFSSTPAFPTDNFQTSNYWADIVFVAADIAPPLVTSVTPINGATGVVPTTTVQAVFNEALDATTVNTSTFELRDASNNLVPATVSYNSSTRTATLTPTSTLTPLTTFTATLKGGTTGSRIKDVAGNALTANYTFSFTTNFMAPISPLNGPGGPILVLSTTTNPFSRFPVEILRAEGLNEFAAADISTITSVTSLNGYDVVVLGEMTLTTTQMNTLTTWVNNGGTLIALRPASNLRPLMGLNLVGTLSDKYLLVNTSSGPGLGIVNQTMQFHGTADLYTLTGGATTIATLYSDATTATTNPAVTLRNVGTNGGKAIAFAFDLAKSVIYTRQGNPAQAGVETDGQTPIRSDDLYFPSYLDMNKVAIPQADEQQRLLANIIIQSNLAKKPLPRFWYMPSGNKAAIVYAADDHSTASGTKDIFNRMIANSPISGTAANWTAYRATSWFYVGIPLTDSAAAVYNSLGFDMGVHVQNGCANFTSFANLDSSYTPQLQAFQQNYPSLPLQTTHRFHCVVWSNWSTQAKVEASHGIRYSMDYYYWPPTWINNRPGLFTGSGIPMRFGDSNGDLLDIYQGVSNLVNENGVDYSLGVNTLLDNALGSKGYYGFFGTHDDFRDTTFSTTVINAAKAHNVPIISAKQALTWLDGRNNSSFGSIAWNNNQLSFTITAYTGADNINAMLPVYSSNGQLSSIVRNGGAVSYTIQTIKGIQYAFFAAPVGFSNYVATYAVDNTAPVISQIVATPNADGVSATITWTTNEGADSRVDYGTSANTLSLNGKDSIPTTSHSIVITGLTAGTTYYFRVTSKDPLGNSATSPALNNSPLSFTMPTICKADITDADFNQGTQSPNTITAVDGDGAVILKPALLQDFTANSLPAAWSQGNFDPNGTTSFSGGAVSVNGSHIFSNNSVAAGTSIEFVATFNTAIFQSVGLTSDQGFNNSPWVVIGQNGLADGTLYARASDGTIISLGTGLVGSSHRYRINWNASNFQVFIDGSAVAAATVNLTVSTNMYLQISDIQTGDGALSVDWIRAVPYATPGSFESRVFDAGSQRTWNAVNWNSNIPSGTSLAISVRTGNTAIPDGTWTAYSPLSASGSVVGATSQYIQYKADLVTNNVNYTPILKDISFSCSDPVSVPAVTTQPTAQSVCSGSNATFTSASSGSPLPIVQWQVSTDGNIWTDISGATSATLTFATSGTDNGKQYRAVWTNSVGSVNSNAALLTVKPIPAAPTVTVTNDCASSTLTASNFTGSLLWSNGATTTSIIVTDAATYTVAQTVNGCASPNGSGVSAPKPIPAAPTVIVQNNCGSSTLTATNYTGSLLWSNGATDPSITVNDAATYTVTQTVNGCISTAGSGISAPKVVPSAPTIQVVDNCGTSILTASNFTGSLLWSNGATTTSTTVSVAGTYTVTQTVNGCTSPNGSAVAAPKLVPAAPTVTVVNNCANSVLTASNYTGSLLWSNGATTPSITVTNNTTYTVTQTGANGCISPAGSGLAAPKPIPTAPTVTVVNNCGSSVLTASNFTGSLLWSNGATTSSITVTNSSTYTVNQTVNGCTGPNGSGTSLPKIIPAKPIITVKGNSNLCEGSSVTLTSSAKNRNLWSNGATTQSIVVSATGTFTVTYTNDDGCSATSDPVTITVNPIPVAPTISVVNNCGNAVLTASGYTGSLLWNNGATTPSITVLSASSYTVTQTVNGCTSAVGSATSSPRAIPAPPTVSVTDNCGNSQLTAGSFAGSLLWSNGASTSSITVTDAATYNVTQTINGCTSDPTSGVSAPKAVPTTPTVSVVNNCGNSQLTASNFTGSLLWSEGAQSTPSIVVSLGGTYSVTQLGANGCTSLPGSALAAPKTIPSAPVVTVNNECGNSVLTASNYGGSLLWSEESQTTPSITVSTAGTYSVTQTMPNGCTSSPATGTAAPNNIPSAPTVSVTDNCGNSVLTASNFTGSLLWSNGQTTTSITVTTGGTYSVTQTTIAGCTSAPASATAAPKAVPASPTITPLGSTTFCQGGSVILLSSSLTNNNWNTGATSQSILATTTGNYAVTFTGANGCVSLPSTPVVVTVNPVTTSTTNLTICSDQLPYSWNGHIYVGAGTFNVTLPNVFGCDSLAVLILSVKDTAVGVTHVSICSNQLPYIWNGNSYSQAGTYQVNGFTNTVGCDSSAVLVLAVRQTTTSLTNVAVCQSQLPYHWNNNDYSVAGDYTITGFTNAAGCDSTATLHLVVNQASASDTTASVCVSYLWHGTLYTTSGDKTFTTTNAAGCDSVVTLHLTITTTITSDTTATACESFIWHGTTYTTSGDKQFSLPSVGGCDSVITLHLTINHGSTGDTTASACDNFLWHGVLYTSSGDKIFTTTNAVGCDSVITLHLTIKHSTTGDTTATACESFLWHGTLYTTSGDKLFTMTNVAGCDSVVTFHLTINHSTSSDTTATACDNFLWHGTVYTTSGDKIFTTTNALGCDSIITLHLTINHTTSSDTTVVACNSYLWNGTLYTTSGIKAFTTVNAVGCDSIAILHLTIKQSTSSDTTAVACNSFLWNGTLYTTSGDKVFTLTNAAGCDSTATLHLTINHSSSSDTTVVACNSFLWNGTMYTTSGDKTFTTTNAVGCDSVANLHLTINQSTSSDTTASACDSFLWQGTLYTTSGDKVFTTVNAAGCDSVITLHLTINHSSTSTTTMTACDSFTWNGETFTQSGTYTHVFAGGNAAGCDSTATLLLTVNHSTSSTTTFAACDSYSWNGTTYTQSGTYTHVFAGGNSVGCDSTATLILTIHTSPAAPTISVSEGITTFCEGGSVILTSSSATGNVWSTGATTQSITVTTSGSYTVSFTDVNGCTSATSQPLVVTVNVPTSSTETITACNSFIWNGNTYTTSGTHTITGLTNAAGCDSTATLVLTINVSTASDTTASACDNFVWHGTLYTTSGDKTYTTTNVAGCDSVMTLHLTINHSTSSDTTATVCDNILWHGTLYTTSGDKLFTTTNAAGCDSVVTLHLTVNHSTTSDTTATACDSFFWHETLYTTSGDKTFITTNAAGCDSIVTLHLTINHSTTSTTTISACDSYSWNGTTYTQSGTYTHVFAGGNSVGCDSTATLILTINTSPAAPTITISEGVTTFCQGGSVLLTSSALTGNIWSNGATTAAITAIASGSYTASYTDGNGCTSPASLPVIVTVNVPTSSTETITTCNSYLWNGTTYTTSGTYTVTGLTNVAGCDSTANLVLTVNHSSSSTTTLSACDSYLWNGTTYTTSGTYTKTGLTNAAGCDSTATLILTINQSPSAPTITVTEGSITFCQGGSVVLTSSAPAGNVWSTGETTQSITVTAGGSYTVSFTDGNSCTSPVSLPIVVTVNMPSSSTTNITTCASQLPYNWNGVDYLQAGTYTIHLTNAIGCDSAATLVLTVNPTSVGGTVSSNATVCVGSNSGTLTLAGQTGAVLRWEQSADGGTTWTPVANTTTSLNYLNLSVETMFRAVVQSGICDPAASSSVTISIAAISVGGTVSGSASVCAGSNSGALTLSGQTGNVVRWEQSVNGGTTWTTIANTTISQSYSNLTQTTMFRAVVQNSVCTSATSTSATISTSGGSVGGTVSGSATLCSLTNSGTLTLSGQTGNVIRWESSTDGGANWTTIANTTTTQSYTNVLKTTQYRAVVQNGSCGPVNSAIATLTLNQVSVTIAVSPDSLVCSGTTISFTATVTNGGTTPTYSWRRNGTAVGTSSTFSANNNNYNNNDVFNLVVTSNATCVVGSPATSNSIKITKYATSAGGTTAGSATYCSTTNSGTVTLSGQTGNVIRWEQSINSGSTWTTIANTTTSQAYSNLTQTTLFRAVVQSGNCSSATSTNATITVTPVTGGTTTGTNSVCSGTNSGTITLSGQVGTILRWMRSTNGGSSWTNISNTTTSQTYSNLTQTTMYVAVMTNGSCLDTSTASTITVGSVGGTVSGAATFCSTTNGGTLTLSGQVGNVIRWEQSTNGTTWTTIANTTTTLNYTNLTQTLQFRAVVQLNACASANATAATVTVTPVAGGTTTGATTVCATSNTGTITLSGQAGTIVRWLRSTTGGAPWTTINNTTTSLTYNNLTATTTYAVAMTNGTCNDTSTLTTITVNPSSVGGSIAGGTTVCANGNSGNLTLSGQTGNVVRWEQSINGGGTWTTIANTTTTQAYTNLTTTTLFRAVVQNGVCATANSSNATVTVTAIAGGTTAGSNSVCTGTNSGSITLSGQTGTISRWESSTDGGTNWTTITNTTTTQTYTNLTTTTQYRARMTAGSCIAFSTVSTITVNPLSVGGTVSGSATVCSSGNSGTVTLAGNTGNVIRWEQSINSGSSWTTISNTTTSQSYTNLTQTTMFRAVVQSGACSIANSSAATITVSTVVGGSVSGSTTVCPNSNSGSLTLSGQTGTIIGWERSTDGGSTWAPIANTTTTQTYSNLTVTTLYHAVIQIGSCTANSSAGTITMNTLPTLTSSLTVSVTSGVPFTYSPTANIPGTTFTWTRAAVVGIDNAASSGSGDINEALTDLTADPIDVTYVYTLTAPTGCVNTQNVVVTVSPPIGGRIITLAPAPSIAKQLATESPVTLDVTAMPNPTTTYFSLVLKSKVDKTIAVRVTDAFGKPVEVRQNIAAGTTLRMGEGWGAGVYFVEVIQGDQRKTLKVVKTN